jgi:N-acetyl-anhydromuramyl-L-alanine amidase AmpD
MFLIENLSLFRLVKFLQKIIKMKSLRLNDSGRSVLVLKRMLHNLGFTMTNSAIFDKNTKQAVRQFQSANGLLADGSVGSKTWPAIFVKGYQFKLGAKDYPLGDDEYFQDYKSKNTIYLHHTAGAHRPDYTIDWWKDKKPGKLNRVATAFVIGRRATHDDTAFDGVTYRAFPEFFWAHHLGLSKNNNNISTEENIALNSASIGIEICALGPLRKESEELYYYVGQNDKRIYVPKSEVCILDQPWRGYRYFQKYTDRQIAECKRLILTLSFLFDIPIPKRTYTREWFQVNEEALNGVSGLWTHCNVRRDKTDCFPQPEFIAMLNALHDDFQTFIPNWKELEGQKDFNPNVEYDPQEINNYSEDLQN